MHVGRVAVPTIDGWAPPCESVSAIRFAVSDGNDRADLSRLLSERDAGLSFCEAGQLGAWLDSMSGDARG